MNNQHYNNNIIKKRKNQNKKKLPNNNGVNNIYKSKNDSFKKNKNIKESKSLTSRNNFKNLEKSIQLSPMKDNIIQSKDKKNICSNSILFQLKYLIKSSMRKMNSENKNLNKQNLQTKNQKQKILVIKSSLLNKSVCLGKSDSYSGNSSNISNNKNNSFQENNFEISSFFHNNSSLDEKKIKSNYQNSLSSYSNKSRSVILYKKVCPIKKKNSLKSLYLYEKNASNLIQSKKIYKNYIYNNNHKNKNDLSQDDILPISCNNTKDKTYNKNSINNSSINIDFNEINNEDIHFAFVQLFQKKKQFYKNLESKNKNQENEELEIINIQ